MVSTFSGPSRESLRYMLSSGLFLVRGSGASACGGLGGYLFQEPGQTWPGQAESQRSSPTSH